MTKPYRSSLFIPIIVLGLLIVFIAIMLVSGSMSATAQDRSARASNNGTLQIIDVDATGATVSIGEPIPYITESLQYLGSPPTLMLKRYTDRIFASGFDQ